MLRNRKDTLFIVQSNDSVLAEKLYRATSHRAYMTGDLLKGQFGTLTLGHSMQNPFYFHYWQYMRQATLLAVDAGPAWKLAELLQVSLGNPDMLSPVQFLHQLTSLGTTSIETPALQEYCCTSMPVNNRSGPHT